MSHKQPKFETGYSSALLLKSPETEAVKVAKRRRLEGEQWRPHRTQFYYIGSVYYRSVKNVSSLRGVCVCKYVSLFGSRTIVGLQVTFDGRRHAFACVATDRRYIRSYMYIRTENGGFFLFLKSDDLRDGTHKRVCITVSRKGAGFMVPVVPARFRLQQMLYEYSHCKADECRLIPTRLTNAFSKQITNYATRSD